VDPVTISVWIIKQLADFASDRARRKVNEFIFGDPLQNALRRPTKTALIAAVDAVLGAKASPENRQRAFDIMGMLWTPDTIVGGSGDTLTEALQVIVARAIDRANAPVSGLGPDYAKTTTLTSLSDELGIRIDGDAFAAAFISNWLVAIRNESLTNELLHPLAELLAHEESRSQAASNHTATLAAILGSEERMREMLMGALQSVYEQGARDRGATINGRLQWFEIHVKPPHELMHEIHDDYRSGFKATLDSLKSGIDLETTMRQLEALRDRKIAGRLGVLTTARRLLKDRPDGVFGASLDASFVAYLEAVEGFQRSDAELNTTWYSHYIEMFAYLVESGEDPHLRSNYPGISAVNDLKGQLAVAIKFVLDEAIPMRWNTYMEAYSGLRTACIAAPFGGATTP